MEAKTKDLKKAPLDFNSSRPNPGREEKINSNFYFHTFLLCLKRFYEGLWKFTLIFILKQLSEMYDAKRVKQIFETSDVLPLSNILFHVCS